MSLPVVSSSSEAPRVAAVGKKIARIEVDRDLCIGAESCVIVAPDVFEMDDENKAVLKSGHGADDQTILMSAQSCPVAAILLFDEEGNQVYP
jgi:ferredoxin